MITRRNLMLFLALLAIGALCGEARSFPISDTIPVEILSADFAERDQLPQSDAPESTWYTGEHGSWGPRAASYPAVEAPPGYPPLSWKRERIVAVAKRYIGLAYQHHHIPAWDPAGEGKGLDCSNFTAWVYNYGLGIKFTSLIHDQSDGPTAPGRRLAPGVPFLPGDLLFITTLDRTRVSHVVIWLGGWEKIIDSHGAGVRVRDFAGWYKDCFSHARRVVE